MNSVAQHNLPYRPIVVGNRQLLSAPRLYAPLHSLAPRGVSHVIATQRIPCPAQRTLRSASRWAGSTNCHFSSHLCAARRNAMHFVSRHLNELRCPASSAFGPSAVDNVCPCVSAHCAASHLIATYLFSTQRIPLPSAGCLRATCGSQAPHCWTKTTTAYRNTPRLRAISRRSSPIMSTQPPPFGAASPSASHDVLGCRVASRHFVPLRSASHRTVHHNRGENQWPTNPRLPGSPSATSW